MNNIAKTKTNLILFLSLLVAFFTVFSGLKQFSKAESTGFDVLPKKNPIAVEEETPIEIFLNSGGNNITSARIVLKFDPTVIQVVSVKHSSLFCTYPDDADSYYVDNDNGLVKLTGFCQNSPVSNNTYELFGEVTVVGRVQGESKITAEFSQAGGLHETAILDDKSPPQNVLLNAPPDILLGVGTSSVKTGDIPETGIDRSWILYLAILVVTVGLAGIATTRFRKNSTR